MKHVLDRLTDGISEMLKKKSMLKNDINLDDQNCYL